MEQDGESPLKVKEEYAPSSTWSHAISCHQLNPGVALRREVEFWHDMIKNIKEITS